MAKKPSAFGVACRHLRMRHDRVMADQAKAFKLSVSFISQLETGQRPVPEGYVRQFADWLRIDERAENELAVLANRGRKIVRVFPKDETRAALASQFANSINRLPEENLLQLRTILNAEHTKKHSDQEVEQLALLLRKVLGLEDRVTFDALHVVENLIGQADDKFYISVVNSKEKNNLGSAKGYTDARDADNPHMVLPEDIYLGAGNHNEDARKTLMHEFAHYLLHRNGVHADARFYSSQNRRPEQEADLFAGAFLLPRHIAMKFDGPEQASRFCKVPLRMAKIQMQKYGLWPKVSSSAANERAERMAGKEGEHRPQSVGLIPSSCRSLVWYATYGWR